MLIISLSISLVSGFITGKILLIKPLFGGIDSLNDMFNDSYHYETGDHLEDNSEEIQKLTELTKNPNFLNLVASAQKPADTEN